MKFDAHPSQKAKTADIFANAVAGSKIKYSLQSITVLRDGYQNRLTIGAIGGNHPHSQSVRVLR